MNSTFKFISEHRTITVIEISHNFSTILALQWRHNGCDSVSNHQPYDCLLNRLLRRRSKKTSKLRVTGLCAGNLPVTIELPLQMTSNTENVSIWWRHHAARSVCICREHLLPIQSLSQYSICDGLAHAHTCPIYFSVIFVTITQNKIILDGRIYVFGIEWPSVITNLQHYWCRLACPINVLHPTPHRTPRTPLHALEYRPKYSLQVITRLSWCQTWDTTTRK